MILNYLKKEDNMVANTLSKKEETKGLLCVISISQYDWVKETRIEWKQDKKACKVIQQLEEGPSSLVKL